MVKPVRNLTGPEAANQFEILGREKKASAIADMMRADGVTPERAGWLPEDGWLRYSQAAGYKRKTPPSAETRRMVLEMLRGNNV
jgi:hypothetical protein